MADPLDPPPKRHSRLPVVIIYSVLLAANALEALNALYHQLYGSALLFLALSVFLCAQLRKLKRTTPASLLAASAVGTVSVKARLHAFELGLNRYATNLPSLSPAEQVARLHELDQRNYSIVIGLREAAGTSGHTIERAMRDALFERLVHYYRIRD